MPLRFQYAIFIIVLHLIIAGLAYQLLQFNKWYFLIAEIFLIISLILSHKLYLSFVRPIELMRSGIDAIKDEDFNVKFLETKSKSLNELIGVFNAMLDKLGDERVRTQEQAYFLESLIAASPIGMMIFGFDGEITNANESACTILDIRDLSVIETISDIDHGIAQAIEQLKVDEPEIISPDGIQKFRCQVTDVVHKGFKRKFVMIEELSKEFLKSEKEAYGKVIRMMAHEVNNSMGAINSILQSVVEFGFQESDPSDQEYVESLNLAIGRNEDLARFMKNFADVVRLPEAQLKKRDIIPLIENVTSIMSPMAAASEIDITVKSNCSNLILPVDLDLMQQVLVNVIKNSIESIKKDGNIIVHISDAAPQIIIADNGAGISEDAKDKLFSPFFSTKPTGQGIGLIIIRDILVGHNCVFSLSTDESTGWTNFMITF